MEILKYFSLVLCLPLLCGCQGNGGREASIASINSNNMQRLTNLYTLFQMQNGWTGPEDKIEFSEFVSSQSERTLKRLGIAPEDVESVFVSEWDNQAFVIRYGVLGSSRGSDAPVIFDSVGSGGSRRVSFTSRKILEVSDDKEYQAYLNGESSSPIDDVKDPNF